jgi:hypothetical protein
VFKRLPFFKIFAIAQVALLVRRHLKRLTPMERKRMGELVRRGHRMNGGERDELRTLVGKLEPAAFAFAAADHFSPIPLRRRGKR